MKTILDSDKVFFREFSKLGLGITAKRNAIGFEKGLQKVNENYHKLKSNVNEFRKNLKWNHIARQHLDIYKNILDIKKDKKDIELISFTSSKLKENP